MCPTSTYLKLSYQGLSNFSFSGVEVEFVVILDSASFGTSLGVRSQHQMFTLLLSRFFFGIFLLGTAILLLALYTLTWYFGYPTSNSARTVCEQYSISAKLQRNRYSGVL